MPVPLSCGRSDVMRWRLSSELAAAFRIIASWPLASSTSILAVSTLLAARRDASWASALRTIAMDAIAFFGDSVAVAPPPAALRLALAARDGDGDGASDELAERPGSRYDCATPAAASSSCSVFS